MNETESEHRGHGLRPAPAWRSMRTRLLELFQPAPERTSSARRWPAVVGGSLLGTFLLLMRQTGRSPLDSLWAEDGQVFLPRAVEGSAFVAVFETAQGYLHLVPRLLAIVASWLPLAMAPFALSGGAALVVALLALFVYAVSDSFIANRALRVVLAASVVLVPVGGAEVFNNAANLHWFLMYAAFWALVWVPQRTWQRLTACMVVLAATVSDPLTIVLAPILLPRLLVRSWRDHLVTATFFAGLLLQVIAISASSDDRALPMSASPLDIVGWYVLRVVTPAVFGERLMSMSSGALQLALAALALSSVLVLAAIAGRAGSDRRPTLALLAVISSALLYMAPTTLSGVAPSRYAVAPVLLLATATISIWDLVIERSETSRLAATIGAIWIVFWLISFPVTNERSDGPSWSREVDRVQMACQDQEGSDTESIAISPRGWEMTAACGHLE